VFVFVVVVVVDGVVGGGIAGLGLAFRLRRASLTPSVALCLSRSEKQQQ
jgi:cation diffusion facilitator CzcD-associated flavoprotein CzcO